MEEYEKKGVHQVADLKIEFESDRIALNIPLKGKTINGWKITPLVRPVVSIRFLICLCKNIIM